MLGIALRQGVNWPHAMKELGACVEAGERLRQDARRVADSFHDESINDEMARTITGQWAVDEWAKKQEGWAGRASNMLSARRRLRTSLPILEPSWTGT
jgi:hypothetical protein